MNLLAQLLNFALAMVFWATLGRILLGLMTGGRENFFVGVLKKATDPAYALVGRVVPQQWVPLGVLILVVAARIALLPLLREP
ncbi:MAG TPA: hypothetical protein VJP45_06415 [Candidatus Limnocylindria bacterium]|nr:hypothetical protein [Candidatus Limnocylindria bacterium]